MPGLDIRPHSHRVSRWAVAGLALVGVGSFTLGVARHIEPAGPSPFPPAQGSVASARTLAAGAIPEATPAPDMQLAVNDPPVRHHAATDAPSETPDATPDDAAAPAASAEAVPAADASAMAPDPPLPLVSPPQAPPPPPNAPPNAPESPPIPTDPTTPPT